MLSKKCAKVNKNHCVACGTCMKGCPRNAITIWKGCYAKIDESLCVGCGKCENVCPAGSIKVLAREEIEIEKEALV